jgi:hypothetical protein
LTGLRSSEEILNFFTKTIMNSILTIIAVILIIGWLIGFVGYSAGGIIHILLVLAIIAVLFRIIAGRRVI